MYTGREIAAVVLFLAKEMDKLLKGRPDLETLEKGVHGLAQEAVRRLLEAAGRHRPDVLPRGPADEAARRPVEPGAGPPTER